MTADRSDRLLRPLRRPVRPGDARAGARRAERGWRDAVADPAFHAELERSRATYVGRPTPLYLAERSSDGRGIYLKREDLCHTGAHKVNNALGQALARAAAREAADRRGDRRGPARRRLRHGLRALRARVRRLHGLGGHAAPGAQRRAHAPARRRGAAGRVRHEDAQGGDKRGDPRLDHERRDDALPDRLLRRAASVPGDRARAPGRDRPRGAGADPGRGGPAAGRGRRVRGRRLERDRALRRVRGRPGVRLVGVEAAGAASLGTGRAGVLHGARSSLLADEDGQIADAHSISAGLDYPGVGPEHAFLRDTGRAEYRGGDGRGGARGVPPAHASARGSSRRSSRPTRSRGRSTSTPSSSSSASRAAATRTSPPCSRAELAVPSVRKRLSIYLMAGPGDARPRRGRGRGRRRPARDRLPVLGSARGRAGDPPRRRARARAGHAHQGVPRVPGRDARRRAAAHPDDVRVASSRRTATSASRGRTGRRRDEPHRRRPAGRGSAGLPRVQLVAPTTPTERIRLAAERTDGWLYLVSLTGTTGARASVSPQLAGPGRAGACGHRGPAARRLRHLDARAGGRGRRARRRDRRRQPRRRGRPRGRPGGLREYVASLRAALD